jgi:predicted ester cyclase
MDMKNTPLVLQRYVDGLKTHDVEKVASTLSDELAFVAPNRTLNQTEFLNMLRALYTAFPDWHYVHADPEIRGGVIAIKWRQSGTHTGTFNMPGLAPIAATGRAVTIADQYFFYTIRHGLIVTIQPDPIPGGAPRGILEQIRGLKQGG